jgi:tol-pal system protein YbgF
MKKLVSAVALLVLAGCATTPKDDDGPMPPPPSQTNAATEQRLTELQTSMTELQTSMTELLERLDVLNDRIGRMEQGSAAPSPAASVREVAPPRAAELQPRPSEPQPAEPSAAPRPQQAPLVNARIADDYRDAIVLFGKGKLADARKGFQHVFDEDPTGDLADNALYWVGETYYAGGDYPSAMRFYKRVIAEFADQNKAPDALFKTALAFEKTGDLGMARTALEEVIRKYPYSTPAASAKSELKRIKY